MKKIDIKIIRFFRYCFQYEIPHVWFFRIFFRFVHIYVHFILTKGIFEACCILTYAVLGLCEIAVSCFRRLQNDYTDMDFFYVKLYTCQIRYRIFRVSAFHNTIFHGDFAISNFCSFSQMINNYYWYKQNYKKYLLQISIMYSFENIIFM